VNSASDENRVTVYNEYNILLLKIMMALLNNSYFIIIVSYVWYAKQYIKLQKNNNKIIRTNHTNSNVSKNHNK